MNRACCGDENYSAYDFVYLPIDFSVIKTNRSPYKQVPAQHKPSHASSHVPNSQILVHGAFFSATDSKSSSPSPSPVPELVGGGFSGQQFWKYRGCSPDHSPILSPRMTSPGPSSRIHSAAATPLHPRAPGAIELPAQWPDGEQQRHRLPLPPINIPNTNPSHSTETTLVPPSPCIAENPSSHGPRWKKGKLLGRGTYGQVYVGFNSDSGEMCAMKEVTLVSDDVKSKESAKQLQQEIALLSQLRHPNIVQYFGSDIVDDKMYIYLEYVSGGSIYNILQNFGQLGEAVIRSYTRQILSGLAYLHSRQTIHRDIKGANLLVDPNGRVKLADFGMAKNISGQSGPLSFKGSPYWMAPEIIVKNSDCNLAVDIWSLGCTLLEMATTKPPWSRLEGPAAIFKIGHSKELPEPPQHLSYDGKDFIKRCLQRNPSDRPSAEQLLEHPFVKYSASPKRPMPCLEPADIMQSVEGNRNASKFSYLDSEAVNTHTSHRDLYVPRNISTFSQNSTSSLLHPRSPRLMSPRLCDSYLSSPRDISSSSTPLTGGVGGGGAIPFTLSKQPTTRNRGH